MTQGPEVAFQASPSSTRRPKRSTCDAIEGLGIFIAEVQPRGARQESRDVRRGADSAPNDQAPVT
jgi:hypothetical protein